VAISPVVDQVGRVVGGRYRLLSLAGSGSSASVYRALDTRLSRTVAVKMLHGALAADHGFIKRFQAEAKSAAALNHPHIVKVFDWGDDEAGPFLVMEYLGGGSLAAIIASGARLSPSQLAKVGLEAAEALDYAHRRGLVHRDIKPANVLFDEEGRTAIADFGLARAFAEAAWTEPAGTLFGTARYASPEQAQGKPTDGRSDVYSLALTLYEAAQGEVPFRGDSAFALAMARVGQHVEPPESAGLVGVVIEGALAPSVDDRIDARRMAEELSTVRRHLPPPEPLPLAGTDSGIAGGAGDATVMGIAGESSTDQGATSTGIAPRGSRRHRRSARSARGRGLSRRARRLVAAAVVVGLLGGGLGYAISTQAFLPHRTVPSLTGMTLERARAVLKARHLGLRVVGHRYSKSVPQGEVARQDPSQRSRLAEGDAVAVVVSEGPPFVSVPQGLDGQSALQAADALGALGVHVEEEQVFSDTVASGRVVSYEPTGSVRWGSTVIIQVSAGPQPVTIPEDLAGKSPAAATSELEALGLKVTEQTQHSATVPNGQVIGSSPAGGQTAHRGDTVVIEVSDGPVMVSVPNVSGDSVSRATDVLSAAGLSPEAVYGPPNGSVYTTDPAPGASVPQGTPVAIYTASG
jgi:beta-lactam-binding protein with PASTA domain/serine/threonine protein kinase